MRCVRRSPAAPSSSSHWSGSDQCSAHSASATTTARPRAAMQLSGRPRARMQSGRGSAREEVARMSKRCAPPPAGASTDNLLAGHESSISTQSACGTRTRAAAGERPDARTSQRTMEPGVATAASFRSALKATRRAPASAGPASPPQAEEGAPNANPCMAVVREAELSQAEPSPRWDEAGPESSCSANQDGMPRFKSNKPMASRPDASRSEPAPPRPARATDRAASGAGWARPCSSAAQLCSSSSHTVSHALAPVCRCRHRPPPRLAHATMGAEPSSRMGRSQADSPAPSSSLWYSA
mmetsp:Transcript_14780/g.48336  ORF Transcript_14780/g.48336 Transcript_14780/m.48336 type:complete len:297 (+) Transcript_14780:294-1184(+)